MPQQKLETSIWHPSNMPRAKPVTRFKRLGLGGDTVTMTVPLSWVSPFFSLSVYCRPSFPS